MLCEKCKKNVATFHYTEVVNGVKNEHHLCSECAANTDASFYSSVFDGDMPFSKLLSGILGSQGFFTDEEDNDPSVHVQCPNCKMTYGDFIKNSSFGCAECYDVFGPLIADKIKKIQGNDRHVGKRPMIYGDFASTNAEEQGKTELKVDLRHEIDMLSKKLKEAIADENFEEAARLRDLIKELNGRDEQHA